MKKNNTNGQNSVATSAQKQNKKIKIDYFLKEWVIPCLLDSKEDNHAVNYPSNKFCIGKRVEYEYDCVDYRFFVALVGEKNEDGSYQIGETIWEDWLSNYAESLGDLLYDGKNITKKIVANINEFVQTNFPELLVPEKEEEVA